MTSIGNGAVEHLDTGELTGQPERDNTIDARQRQALARIYATILTWDIPDDASATDAPRPERQGESGASGADQDPDGR